jgi:hypothetical protein
VRGALAPRGRLTRRRVQHACRVRVGAARTRSQLGGATKGGVGFRPVQSLEATRASMPRGPRCCRRDVGDVSATCRRGVERGLPAPPSRRGPPAAWPPLRAGRWPGSLAQRLHGRAAPPVRTLHACAPLQTRGPNARACACMPAAWACEYVTGAPRHARRAGYATQRLALLYRLRPLRRAVRAAGPPSRACRRVRAIDASVVRLLARPPPAQHVHGGQRGAELTRCRRRPRRSRRCGCGEAAGLRRAGLWLA